MAYSWAGEAALLVGLGVLCFYQVALNYQVYLEGVTRFSITEGGLAQTPPVIVCAYPTLDPRTLLQFGLDLENSDFNQAKRRMDELIGVLENASLSEVASGSGWRLGQLVKELWFGDDYYNYDIETVTSPLWETHYYHGPCHLLKPTLVPQGRQFNLTLRVQTKEQIIHDSESNNTTDPNISIAYQLLKRLFHVQIYFSSISKVYMRSRQASPRPYIENILALESYSVKLMSWRHSQDPDMCRRNCYEILQRKEGYCLIVDPKPGQQVGKCSTLINTFGAEPCLQKCRSRTYSKKWLLVDLAKGADPYIHKIILGGTHKLLWEEEVYPLQKFMSDLGGSLGLFLGLSLASVLSAIHAIYEKRRNRLGDKTVNADKLHLSAWSRLLNFNVNMIILFLLSVHAVSSFYQLAIQSAQTSVKLEATTKSLRTSTNVPPSTVLTPANVRDALAARLASRSFGCRLTEAFDNLLQCIMLDQLTYEIGSAPFFNLDDLPICTDDVLQEIPLIKFILPNPLMTLEEVKSAMDRCFQNQNFTFDQPKILSTVEWQIKHEASFEVFRIFVEVGGIIGLYFGLSFFFLVSLVLEAEWSKKWAKVALVCLRWAGVILVIVTVYMCTSQLLGFIFSHPVSSFTSSIPLQDESPLEITVCPWPPIKRDKFLASIGVSAESNNETNFNEVQWMHTINSLVDNYTSFIDAWNLSQWDLQDLISMYLHGGNYSFPAKDKSSWRLSTIGGQRCFTYKPLSHTQAAFSIMSALKSSARNYYTVHSLGEKPFIMDSFSNEMVSQKTTTIMDATTYLNWGYEDQELFGNCYDRCVTEGAARLVNCSLPLFDFQTDNKPPVTRLPGIQSMSNYSPKFVLVPCNASIICELLKWAFNNKSEGYPKPMYPFSSQRNTCIYFCRKKPKTFLTLHQLGDLKTFIQKTATSFTVLPNLLFAVHRDHNFDSRAAVKEYDGYTTSQLVSDVGGVVGVLLGASLVTLIKGIVTAFNKRFAGPKIKKTLRSFLD